MFLRCFLWFYFFSCTLSAAQLPRQLSESDRLETLKILGFGSATKLNSDPTPLGGKSGFEFFVSNDVISIAEVQKLGDRSGSGDQMFISSLGFGKGLFFDIDTFVFFSPLQFQSKYSQLGASLRKVIYTHSDLPFQAALSLHGNGTNYENLISLTTTGLDLVLSYEWPELAFSAGIGQGRSIGTFIGGASGVNNTTETFTQDIQQRHWLTSISKRWDKTYLSLQYDRYFDSTVSFKIGYRL